MKKGNRESRKRKPKPMKDLAATLKRATGVKGGGINRIVVTDGKISASIKP